MVAPIVGEFAFVVTSLLDDLVFVLASPIDELGTAFANACSVISHPVRRKVLVILTEREAATRTALADELAVDEGISIEDTERLDVLLHHNHLRKLDEHQYVAYDRRHGDVALWKDPKSVEFDLDSR